MQIVENPKTQNLEKVIKSYYLSNQNNKSQTHLNLSTGSFSSIDIALHDLSS